MIQSRLPKFPMSFFQFVLYPALFWHKFVPRIRWHEIFHHVNPRPLWNIQFHWNFQKCRDLGLEQQKWDRPVSFLRPHEQCMENVQIPEHCHWYQGLIGRLQQCQSWVSIQNLWRKKYIIFRITLYIYFWIQCSNFACLIQKPNIDDAEVLLLVLDTNDNVSDFEHSQYTVHVVEEMICDDPIFVFQNHFFDHMNSVWRMFKFWSVVIGIKD